MISRETETGTTQELEMILNRWDGPTARGWQIRWPQPFLSKDEYERIAGPFFMFGWWSATAFYAVVALAAWLVIRCL